MTGWDTMPALTLHQPWAQLVAIGEKRVETRSWKTSYRGLLAIHAGATIPKYAEELMRERHGFAAYARAHLHIHGFEWGELPLGAIVAVAQLVDCIPTEVYFEKIGDDRKLLLEHEYGNFDEGRYAWILNGADQLVEPVPARGKHQLWQLSDAERRAVHENFPFPF